ncbi:MAG: hypothetical protein KUG79_07255 [Pseudomonadales bacterium]|nr:hypothetical protein [Pseudomonadales bacterium]
MPVKTLLVVLFFTFLNSNAANAVDLRFSGFGDVIYGVRSDDPADRDEAAAFAEFGPDAIPFNAQEGFTITGIDFVVIADMTEEFTFLAELNFQTLRGETNEIETDMERIFINYEFSEAINLQAGLYFTPVGYHNRFLYSRAWLMNSIQIADLFEEELNLAPTHSIGANVHGTIHFDNGHAMRYIFGIANGRGEDPVQAKYARDEDDNVEYTWLLEWVVPMFNESRLGISGWFDKVEGVFVPEFGDVISIDDPGAQQLRMDETGFNAYLVIRTHHIEVLAEYVLSGREDTTGLLDKNQYDMTGFTFEVSYRAMAGQLHPYIRYDVIEFEDPGGDPWLSLREDGGNYEKVYLMETEALMVGLAYDLNAHARVKVEYVKNNKGARREDAFAIQFAYGF